MPFYDLDPHTLQTYAPDVAEPPDFDDFWAATLAEARRHDLDLHVDRVESGLRLVDVYDVRYAGFGGQPVRAWLTVPAHADGPLPGIVEFVGYGGGRGLAHEHLTWAAAGYAHLVMDTRGQGSRWGSGGDTPDPVGSGPATPGFVTRGLLDPHEHYYRRVFTDAVRAVEALRAVDGVDASRVAVTGGSQGGGITLAVAGLVPGLVGVLPDVPFGCHYRRAVEITDDDPYHELTAYLSVHRDHVDQAFRTLSYLDGVNFARRADAPALFSVALMDTTCPPSTVYAAFNAYGTRRPGATDTSITVYPYNRHEGGAGHQVARQLPWLATRMAAAGTTVGRVRGGHPGPEATTGEGR